MIEHHPALNGAIVIPSARRRILFALIALALCCALCVEAAETLKAKPSGLLSAIAAEEVRVDARGTGASAGDCLRLEVVNLTDQDKVLILPSGVVAHSEDPGAPDMAIQTLKGKLHDAKRYEQTKAIRLGPNESAAYICEAFSMDFKKGTPETSTRFRLGARKAFLQCLFNEARDARPSLRALQAAIWIHYSKTTREELDRQFPVSSPDFAVAQGLVRVCETKLSGGKVKPGPGNDDEFDPLKPPSGYVPLRYRDDEDEDEAPTEDLTLKAGKAVFSGKKDERSVTVPLLFKWNVPPDDRARICAAVMRFDTPEAQSAVMVANLDFSETEGRYDMVVTQGKLAGRGELVYGVFRSLTNAALQPELESLFETEEGETSRRISNWLRIPLDWDKGEQPRPADSRPASQPASPLIEKAISAVRDITKPTPASAPTPRPRLTPVPLEKRDWPVYVALPLANGGVLRGDLSGKQNGHLVVKIGTQRILFDPARLKHSAEQLLAEAKTAYNEGRKHAARQYAAAATLLLEDSTEAKALLEKCR